MRPDRVSRQARETSSSFRRGASSLSKPRKEAWDSFVDRGVKTPLEGHTQEMYYKRKGWGVSLHLVIETLDCHAVGSLFTPKILNRFSLFWAIIHLMRFLFAVHLSPLDFFLVFFPFYNLWAFGFRVSNNPNVLVAAAHRVGGVHTLPRAHLQHSISRILSPGCERRWQV